VRIPHALALFGAGAAVAVAPACGGSGQSSAPPTPSPPAQTAPTTGTGTRSTPTTTSGAPGALQAEATAAATGDIPDNQAFLVFRNAAGGYSIKYPEGWAQQGSGKQVTFRDKNNIVRIVVEPGKLPGANQIKGLQITKGPEQLTIGGKPAIKVTYTTQSPPSPVTGKRVKLMVDRYYVAGNGKLAIIDLGTPEGVDNVDAFRLMSESFRWH
jgi:hypothetical protein